MQNTYQHQDHKLVEFTHQAHTIRVIRYAPTGLALISDLAKVTGDSVNRIRAEASPFDIHTTSLMQISNVASSAGSVDFIPISIAVEILKMRPGLEETARALEKWNTDQLNGNQALIADGMTVSAKLLFDILGPPGNFLSWVQKVLNRYPGETRGTGFQGGLYSAVDFPVPLNLAEKIARGEGAFKGQVVSEMIHACGFYKRSLLRQPFLEVVEDYRDVIPALNNGLVDARRARRILNEGASFDLWLQLLKKDFPMRWNTDYFCETPIPEWTQPQIPQRMRGPVLFTASLIEKIALEPVYDHGFYDFTHIEHFCALHKQYQAAGKSMKFSATQKSNPLLSK